MFGVGKDNDDALAQMSRTKGGSRNNIPPQIIAERGNLSNDSQEVGENKDTWRVFKDSESGSKLAYHSEGFGPEPAFVSSTAHVSECACRLARHAARNDERKAKAVGEFIGADAGAVPEFVVATGAPALAIFVLRFAVMHTAAELGYIAQVGDVRPVMGEDERGVGVGFAKGDGLETGVLKADGEAADAAEQVKMGEFIHFWLSSAMLFEEFAELMEVPDDMHHLPGQLPVAGEHVALFGT